MIIVSCLLYFLLFSLWSTIECINHDYSSSKLNIHLVPHTHDDVGWLKTVDQYYMGSNNTIQHAGVQYILDTVIHSLSVNGNRTFIYCESAFFERWWNSYPKDHPIKDTVRKLVANGQLEFVNGGYSMHDEATTHYVDMIDQTTLGHAFLTDNFNYKPTVAWQIDPFGHSSTQATLLGYEAGFTSLHFARIDWADHDLRCAEKRMEFIWRPSISLRQSAQIFTQVFAHGYGPVYNFNSNPLTGFCYDLQCDNVQPIIDDPRLYDDNINFTVRNFIYTIKSQYALFYQGNHIQINMGRDFQYENANMYYKNLDKLIEYVNAEGTFNMFYSTPSAYVAAKQAENLTFTVKTDDFFPYSDHPHSYWTGFYTSRPTFKGYVRQASSVLNYARQIELFTFNKETNISGLSSSTSSTSTLWRANSIVQHHDSVAGTAKQHVDYDYAKRLSKGITQAQIRFQQQLAKLIANNNNNSSTSNNQLLQLYHCNLMNISICNITQQFSPLSSNNNTLTLLAVYYNPRMHIHNDIVHIPIDFNEQDAEKYGLQITDDQNNVINYSITYVLPCNAYNINSSLYRLWFQVQVPSLSYQTYLFNFNTTTDINQNNALHKTHIVDNNPDTEFISVTNGLISLEFSTNTGLLTSYTDEINSLSIPLSQQFGYYIPWADKHSQSSGAYILRLQNQTLQLFTEPAKITVQYNNLVTEVYQSVNEYITQIYRLYPNSTLIEIEYSIGPIPVDNINLIGKEIISRYSIDNFDSNSTLYTDANGWELQRRILNYRPSWPLNVTEPVAGNYYPVNSIASIISESQALQFTVVNDRAYLTTQSHLVYLTCAQAVASLNNGEIEYLLHRRLLVDDSKGLNEPLNETDIGITPYPDWIRKGKGIVTNGKHWLSIESIKTAAAVYRPKSFSVYRPITQTFALAENLGEYKIQLYNFSFSALQDLPINVELQTLQLMDYNSETNMGHILLRLGHIFGVGESDEFSIPVEIDLTKLLNFDLNGIIVTKITETSITGNREINNLKINQDKMRWKTIENDEETEFNNKQHTDNDRSFGFIKQDSGIIRISPLEVKTFIMSFTIVWSTYISC